MERGGLRATDERGVIYNLLADRWELSTDTDVNYMVLAEKAAERCHLAASERMRGMHSTLVDCTPPTDELP